MSTYNAAIMAKAIELMNRSTNTNRQVGAVITNGVGAHNTNLLNREGPETTLHAEAQAVCWSSAEGIATKGHDIYVTLSPCIACAKLIFQSGIRSVYFYELDTEQPLALKILQDAGVALFGPMKGQ